MSLLARPFRSLFLSFLAVIQLTWWCTAQTPQFVAYEAATQNTHQDYLTGLRAEGYRPVSLSLHGTATSPRYAAVWLKQPGPDWREIHNVTISQFWSQADALALQGFKPSIVAANGSLSNPRLAAVFEHAPDSQRTVSVGIMQAELDEAVFWAESSERKDNGLWLDFYGPAETPRYVLIREALPALRPWNLSGNVSAAEIIPLLEAQRAQWARPQVLAVNEGRFSALWVEDGIQDWQAVTNLSQSEFNASREALEAVGYFPWRIHASGSGIGTVFAAVFVRQAQPPPLFWSERGRKIPELTGFDEFLRDWMAFHSIKGATLAITHEGRLVYARAFTRGESDYPAVQPDAPFRVGSMSKVITSAVTLQLYESGAFQPDSRIQPVLQLEPPAGETVHPFLDLVTVDHLVKHQGGWDRNESGLDPIYADRLIASSLGVDLPVSKFQVATFMTGQPMQFVPGTRAVYSNYGYNLLGQMIGEVTGQTYEEFVRSQFFDALGIRKARIGRSLLIDQSPEEPRYHSAALQIALDVFDSESSFVPFAYGGFHLDRADAEAGWVISAPELARFLIYLEGLLSSRSVDRAEVLRTLSPIQAQQGFSRGALPPIYLDGWIPGSAGLALGRGDGTTLALLINRDIARPAWILDEGFQNEIFSLLDGVDTWPEHNLFPEFGIGADPAVLPDGWLVD